MSELDELRAAVAALTDRVQCLEDQQEIGQLVAQYGPAVDSGAAAAAAELWTEDGTFVAVGAIEMHGREQIAGMVNGQGHQSLILNGCGHVLTAPHITLDGDEATGRKRLGLSPRGWDFRHTTDVSRASRGPHREASPTNP
jgi:hypothetical protein